MRSSHVLLVMFLVLVAARFASAQQPPSPTPGPEHEHLKALEGTWDAAMTMAGSPKPIAGMMTYKMECGGLWLVSDYRTDAPEFKFHGKGFDSYDPAKKKYVGVWVDSMVTAPLVLEGTYDSASKSITMLGEGPGSDGKLMKFKNVTKITDADHQSFQMFEVGADGKEKLSFTIEFTRKK